jgi:hypothetical protein
MACPAGARGPPGFPASTAVVALARVTGFDMFAAQLLIQSMGLDQKAVSSSQLGSHRQCLGQPTRRGPTAPLGRTQVSIHAAPPSSPIPAVVSEWAIMSSEARSRFESSAAQTAAFAAATLEASALRTRLALLDAELQRRQERVMRRQRGIIVPALRERESDASNSAGDINR